MQQQFGGRRRGVLLVAVVVGVLVGPVGSRPAVHAAVGDPTLGPLISGTTSLLAGTHVWTDYAYDDRGTEAPTASPTNAADLIQVQLQPTVDGLAVRAVLETLTDPSAPSVGVGIDLDADPTSGSASVPGGGWQVAGTPLGLERVIEISDGGARILRWDGAQWVPAWAAPATVDVEDNTVDTTVPWDLLPDLGPRWRVIAVAGRVVDGASWVDGTGPIDDLAYVRDESTSNFQSNVQAAVLSGGADASTAVATIDLGAVATTTQLAQPVPGIKNTFLYRSALQLGEGMGPDIGNRKYAGPYQPYAAWFPEDLPVRPPLVVFLHGAMSDHLSGSYGGSGSFVPGLPLGPGEIAPRAVVVTPLARGELAINADGPAEQDILDVIADVSARFDVDSDRVVLSGYSLGGVGTFRLAELYPDRWAGAVEFVGADDFGAIGLVQELGLLPIIGEGQSMPNALENLRNLPFRMAHGRADELELLIGGVQPDRAALELQALGYDYRYWQFYARDHITFPVAMVQCEIDAAIGRGRVHDPARVTYSQAPAILTDEPSIGLHLTHDGAYWVSEMTPRGAAFAPGSEVSVDVTSLARADREPALQPIVSAGQNIVAGQDVCGPDPSQQGFDIWTELGQAWMPGQPQPTSNALQAKLTGVASVTVDLPRMSLDVRQPLALQLDSDGPTVLRLVGPWVGAVLVESGGEAQGVACASDGVLEVMTPGGAETVQLLPTGSGC